MRCPNCDSETQDDAIFCDQCGKRLTALPAAETAPVTKQPVEAAPAQPTAGPAQPTAGPAQPTAGPAGILCPSCGVRNTPGEMFCSECGTPLESLQPEPEALAAPEPADMPAEGPDGAPICPDCRAAIQPGEEYCFACGAELKSVSAPAAAPAPEPAPIAELTPEVKPPAPQAATPIPAEEAPPAVEAGLPVSAPAALAECPSCGGRVNAGDTFCGFCGAALVTSTPPESETVVSAPAAATAAPTAPVTPQPVVRARLVVAESNIEIPLPDSDELIVGREDPVNGIFPEVDLTPHRAEEGGVSRRHFRMRRSGSIYTVEDLNSTNFTLVNLQRLEAGRPAPLSDGDEIRAGRVRLIFKVGA